MSPVNNLHFLMFTVPDTDMCDGMMYPDEKMNGFMEIPVDEDDYLQPNSSHPAHYMDVIDCKFLQ